MAEHLPSMCEVPGSILNKTLVFSSLRFLWESDGQFITEEGGDYPSADSGHSVGCPGSHEGWGEAAAWDSALGEGGDLGCQGKPSRVPII